MESDTGAESNVSQLSQVNGSCNLQDDNGFDYTEIFNLIFYSYTCKTTETTLFQAQLDQGLSSTALLPNLISFASAFVHLDL